MKRSEISRTTLSILPALVLVLIMVGCATIGTPEGGPKDTTPPYVTKVNPPEGALNFRGKRITLTLNKNVQLQDAFNRIVVSPSQIQAPTISSNGRHVTLTLNDTLLPNTTYTIDFADAIKDLNEGNVLDGYATDFSTGDTLDSLRISGLVVNARTLEPAQGMIVGVYSNLSDTALTTLPLERITKSNASGQFTIRNLKPIPYRLFAINDINRDFHWDRSEDVAFYDSVIIPWTEKLEFNDTIHGTDNSDSIVVHSITKFLPNDILLTWFNEDYKAQYIKDYSRPARNIVKLELGAPTDSLPRLTIVGPDSLAGTDIYQVSVPEYGATMDTLTYYLKDYRVLSADSLRAAVSILRPDSLERLTWQTDTLRFYFSDPKKTKKELEAEAKVREKEIQDSIARGDSIPAPKPPTQFVNFDIQGGTSQDLHLPLRFKAGEPLDSLLQSAVRMEMRVDTIWREIEPPIIELADSTRPLYYVGRYEWTPQTTYRLTIDSASIVGIYGLHSNKLVHEFTTKSLADYGTITFRIEGLHGLPAVVELLDPNDNPVVSRPVSNDIAQFTFLSPGAYYVRLFIDKDSAGVYGNGNISSGVFRQPDDVYYFQKKLELKRNWDIDQPWDINAFPVDTQKPYELRKNKAGSEAKPKEEVDEEITLPPGVHI